MSQSILRVPGCGALRLSDITVNSPGESYKFRDIRVDAIDVILSDRTVDPVSIQITATCTLEASRTDDPPATQENMFPELPKSGQPFQWKSETHPRCRHEVRPMVPTRGIDFGVEVPFDLPHEHNFRYQGIVDGKHRFMCTCGEVREEELANGSRSQQDSTGPDASNQ